MVQIDFKNGEHSIQWTSTPEQDKLMWGYRQPLKRALAEEQASRYRRNPDKYRMLADVASLVDEGVYEPYLGAVDGGERFIMHKTEDGFAVQYQYLDRNPIWLTGQPSMKSGGVYRVEPTALGYIVHYEIDITNYDEW